MALNTSNTCIHQCNLQPLTCNICHLTFDLFNSRGYAEAEIEAVFAKYDLDGDRVLDEVEQRNMQADLEGQKVILGGCFNGFWGPFWGPF